jgi:hypothetical protein
MDVAWSEKEGCGFEMRLRSAGPNLCAFGQLT